MSNVIQLGKPADLAKMGREIVRSGYPVFPINSDKQPLDFNVGRQEVLDCITEPSPEAADGKSGLYLYTRNPKDVTRLSKLTGCAGWAVPTGEVSGVTAVDFDTYKDSPDLKAALEDMEGDLQDTRQHRTLSGGVHYLFTATDIGSKNGVVEGLDVKGNGGYVVWPPTPGYKVSHDVDMLPLPDVVRDLMSRRSSAMKQMTIDAHLLEVAAGKAWHENILQVALKAQRIGMSALKCQERVIEAAELAVRKRLRSRSRLDALLRGELDRMFTWSEDKLGDDTEDLADLLPDGASMPFGDAPQEPQDAPEGPEAQPDYMAWLSRVSHGVYEDDIVEDLIEVQSLGVLYGLPGTGKSFVAFDIAAHVATGKPWMGRYTRQGPVLYIAAEAGRVIEQRSLAWCRHYKIADGSIDNMLIYSGGIDLTKPFKSQERLLEALGQRQWSMIVIDTIGAACGGTDLSSQEEWSVISDNLFKLVSSFKCHVLAVHHANKSNTLFGSVYAQADAQTILKVTVEEDKSRFISNEKQRNLELMHGGLYFDFKSYTVGQKRTPDGKLSDVSSAVIVKSEKTLSDRELLMQEAGTILRLWASKLLPSQVPTVEVENMGVERRITVAKDYALSALKAEGKETFDKLNFSRPSNKSEFWKFLKEQGFIAERLPKERGANRYVGFMCD